MAIQITQDPINNFFDNLPRYALDLKQQDDTARFRDKQLSENIRQFNERQLQQQSQFAQTLGQRRSEFDRTLTQREKEFQDEFGLKSKEFRLKKGESEFNQKITAAANTRAEKNQKYLDELREKQEAGEELINEVYTNVLDFDQEIKGRQANFLQLRDDNPAIFNTLERMIQEQKGDFPQRTLNYLAGIRKEGSDEERIEYLVNEKRKVDEYIKTMQNRTGQTREQILAGFEQGVYNKSIFDIPREFFGEIVNTDMYKFQKEYNDAQKEYQSVQDVKIPDLISIENPYFKNNPIYKKELEGYYNLMQNSKVEALNKVFYDFGGIDTKYDYAGREVIDFTGNAYQTGLPEINNQQAPTPEIGTLGSFLQFLTNDLSEENMFRQMAYGQNTATGDR